jgi:hypothetical protein
VIAGLGLDSLAERGPDSFALFPLVHCAACGAERLGFRELDERGDLALVCALCATPGPLSRWVDDSVLSAQGLRVRAKDPVEAKTPKKTGCSNAGTCSSSRSGEGGGCSSGSCGSCGSGGCGS